MAASDGGHARARAAAEAGVDLGLQRACWVLVRTRCARCAAGSSPRRRTRRQSLLRRVEAVEPGLAARRAAPARDRRGLARARAARAPSSLVLLRPTALAARSQRRRGRRRAGRRLAERLRPVRRRRRCAGARVREPRRRDGTPVTAAALPDFAWGGRWPAAGVHAGGGIWAAGIDTGELDPLPATRTPPTRVGAGRAGRWSSCRTPSGSRRPGLTPSTRPTRSPTASCTSTVCRRPCRPASPGRARWPASPTPPPATSSASRAAASTAASRSSACATPPGAPVTVVIEGDAVLGARDAAAGLPPAPYADGVSAAFRGALVVTGRLEVAAPSGVDGPRGLSPALRRRAALSQARRGLARRASRRLARTVRGGA